MEALVKQAPEIIKAASTSALGIIALMILVLAVLAYSFFRNSPDWVRFACFALMFAAAVSYGVAVVKASPPSDAKRREQAVDLKRTLAVWLGEYEKARSARTVSSTSPLPTSLVTARSEFESSWRNTPLAVRQALEPSVAFKALSGLNRSYRVQEKDSSTQTNAMAWADESIRFFEEKQDRKYLTEALLDKAAIYLDIAQLGHSDQTQFERVAKDGDAVMTRAYQTADAGQRPVVLRISSRFYYNIARPKSFRLSDEWDNNYLLLAYEKVQEAMELAPTDIKNANQLARTVIKTSKNPPQDKQGIWTDRLRDAKNRLKRAWEANKDKLESIDERLSPLNVLGVVTLETVIREWRDSDPKERRRKAAQYEVELDADSLSPLRAAIALLQNSELRKAYGFDLYYDIGRAHAVKTVVLRPRDEVKSRAEFLEVLKNIEAARESAKTSQLDAAASDIERDLSLSLMTQQQKVAVTKLLALRPK